MENAFGTVNIHKLCCICLCENESFPKTTENLLFKIKKLCDIKFSSKDLVCELCQGEVDKCYSFSITIINNYNELKRGKEKRKVKEGINDFESNIDLNAVKNEEVIIKDEIQECPVENDIISNVQIENCMKSNVQIVSSVECPDRIFGHLIYKPEANVISQAQNQSSSNLNIVKAAPPEIRLKCQYCSETFTRQSSLDIHLINHQGLKYTCECGAKFGLQSRLNHDMREEHKSELRISCEDCGEKFQKKNQLRTHQKIHLAEIPKVYRCDICDKEFKLKCHLKYHCVRHMNERAFQCDVCGDKFNLKSDLASHMRIHSNERKYLCSYCGKRFKAPETMKIHIRTHTGERPFQCEVCEMRVTQGSALKTHMKVHMKSKTKKRGK